MRKFKLSLLLAMVLAVIVTTGRAQAQWIAVKKSLQKEVQVIEETASRLVLSHRPSQSLLILTTSKEPDSDIYAALEVRRDGNPYRIWATTEKFWNKPHLAEDAGGKFFHVSFSKALRREESIKDVKPLPLPPAMEKTDVIAEAESTQPPAETMKTQGAEIANSQFEPVAGEPLPSPEKANSLKASLYEQAKQYEAAGELEMAIAVYENLTRSGDFKDARTRLLAVRNQIEQNRIVAENERQYESGVTALKEKDWSHAVAAFEKILIVDPDFRDSRKRLAQAKRELRREKTEKAVADHYAEGIAAMNRKDLQGAVAAFEKVRELDPNNQDAADLLVQAQNALQQQAQTAAAMAALSAQLDSLYRAALIERAKNDWPQAAVTLEKIKALQPAYRDVASLLAETRAKLNPTEASVSPAPAPATRKDYSLYIAGALAATLGFIFFSPGMRARYHIFRNNHATAVAIYERVLARHPQRTKLYPLLANLYLLLDRRDEQAMKVYKMVLQLKIPIRNRDQINSIVAQNYLNEGRIDSDGIEVLENKLKTERQRQGSGNKSLLGYHRKHKYLND